MTRGFVLLQAAVLTTGIGALAWGTEGFRVITSEGARRLAIEHAAPPVPDVALLDQDGNAFSLTDYRGKALLIEFIYTHCPTLCGVLGDDFRQVLALERDQPSDRRIALLSVSFDPQNDDQAALKLYAERYGATSPRWRVAAPTNKGGLATLLKTFGVVVVPDGMGSFVHNGAVYVVNAEGRLVRILDPDAPPQLISVTVHAPAS